MKNRNMTRRLKKKKKKNKSIFYFCFVVFFCGDGGCDDVFTEILWIGVFDVFVVSFVEEEEEEDKFPLLLDFVDVLFAFEGDPDAVDEVEFIVMF